MKKKLLDRYGDQIIVTEINGKSNVVTFRRTAAPILHDFYDKQRMEHAESETMRIIGTAAKLIKSDIKSMVTSSDSYPNKEHLSSADVLQFLPKSLHRLLQLLFVGQDTDLKQASIGQAIMQAVRPRVLLAPLQYGLSVDMHHRFASRYLIDTLYQHGFGCSYSEIQKFERSATLQGVALPQIRPEQFVQFVADIVDQNIRTIDWMNTFHGMGIIATFTPGEIQSKPVPRVVVSNTDIKQFGGINIRMFHSQHTAKPALTSKELKAM